MQMQSAMGENGMGGMGGMGGLGGLGGLGGFGGAGAGAGAGGADGNTANDPFPNLFAPGAGAAAGNTAGAAAGNTAGNAAGATGNTNAANPSSPGAGAPPNPFAALLGGAGGAGMNPFMMDPSLLFGGAGAGGAAAPRDDRPPEEIYATQLGQLNAMGLWDAQKNIRALRSTGGNVEAAIELIFSGSLDNQ